jgi:hypothetical protein
MIEELIPVIELYQALLLSGYNPQEITHLINK